MNRSALTLGPAVTLDRRHITERLAAATSSARQDGLTGYVLGVVIGATSVVTAIVETEASEKRLTAWATGPTAVIGLAVGEDAFELAPLDRRLLPATLEAFVGFERGKRSRWEIRAWHNDRAGALTLDASSTQQELSEHQLRERIRRIVEPTEGEPSG